MSLTSSTLDSVQPVGASPQPVARPVSTGERLTALDALRGFALLGILLMNIVGFGLYSHAYDNPTSAGGATGVNLWCWIVLHVLAEGKMRCLFSLVFGASMILFTSRMEGRPDAADVYYRRTLWLLLFGVIHAYLLWQGEILYPYAICGLALYPFRKISPRSLILIGALGLLLVSGFVIVQGILKREDMTQGKAAIVKAELGEKLSDEEKEARDDWEESVKKRNPSPEDLQKDAKEWQGSFVSIIKARGKLVNEWNSIPYYHPYMFDMWGMMFLGMGLMKLGVLGGQRSTRFYALMVAIGYTVGFLVNGATAAINVRAGFDPVVQSFAGSVYQLGRLAVTCGHLGVNSPPLQNRQAALPDRPVERRWPDGFQQLHDALRHLRVSVYRIRLRPLWAAGTPSTLLRRGRDLDRATHRQPDLAAAFSFWPARMGLALADLLEAPAVSDRRLKPRTVATAFTRKRVPEPDRRSVECGRPRLF